MIINLIEFMNLKFSDLGKESRNIASTKARLNRGLHDLIFSYTRQFVAMMDMIP